MLCSVGAVGRCQRSDLFHRLAVLRRERRIPRTRALDAAIWQVADVPTGFGELDLSPARGEELADSAPLRTGQGFRASLCYTVSEVHYLTA